MHELVVRSALQSGHTFSQQLNVLVSNKVVSRTSARAASFANADVRAEEMQRGYVTMGTYSNNDWNFKRKVATRMGLKSTGSIDKKIDNLNICSENRMMLGLSGQWSRLEQRDSLNNLSIMELFGRRHDRDELFNFIRIDIEDYGFSKELFDVVRSVAAGAIAPNFDRSTCSTDRANVIARNNNLSDKNDIEKCLKSDLGDDLPPPVGGVKIVKGEMRYEINDSFIIVVELKTPIVDLYVSKRSIIINLGKKNGILSIFMSGGVPHLDATGKYCMMYNFPHAGWTYKCTDPNCEGKRICMMCGSNEHGMRYCRVHQSCYATVEYKNDCCYDT